MARLRTGSGTLLLYTELESAEMPLSLVWLQISKI